MNNFGQLFKKISILVLILAVPGFLYYLLTAKGKNRYHPLPIYGPKELAKTFTYFHGKAIPDTVYHAIPDFKLTDQDTKPVTQKALEHKITIVGFFYTACPTVCAKLNHNMASLAKEYQNNRLIGFMSITVDPEHDTAAKLLAYKKQYGIKPGKWEFLTGDTTAVYGLARNGFLVNAVKLPGGDFVYSDKLILIDADKRIRGYYGGTLDAEIDRLDGEIKVQITEELRKIKAPY